MKNQSVLQSYRTAISGLSFCLKSQKNIRMMLFIAIVVITISLFLDLGVFEYMALSLTITLVLIAEMINSSLEYVVDMATEEFNPLAKAAKDIAAAAVMLATLNAIAIAILFIISRLR